MQMVVRVDQARSDVRVWRLDHDVEAAGSLDDDAGLNGDAAVSRIDQDPHVSRSAGS
jgi:hypothetical protein